MADGTENLIPFDERTEDEAREISRKGGKASGAARRKKKKMKEIAETLMAMQITKGQAANIDTIRCLPELKGKNITGEEAMIFAVFKNALNGDLQAVQFMRDITDQKPQERLQVETVKSEGKLAGILKQLEQKKEDD